MSIEVLDSRVDVPGGSVFVRLWSLGRSNRAPIILLHDSLGCVDLWREFPEALAKATTRDVIAYDRLGFGKSTPRIERPSVGFVFEEAEIFFPAIPRALGLTRFSLFGHSVGGAMAIVVAASQGEGCEAVITESAQAFVEPLTLSSIRAAKERFGDPTQLEKIANKLARPESVGFKSCARSAALTSASEAMTSPPAVQRFHQCGTDRKWGNHFDTFSVFRRSSSSSDENDSASWKLR